MSDGIKLLILSDGKPGHVAGSLGVLASLQRLTSIQHVKVEVRLRLKLTRRLIRALLNRPRLLSCIPLSWHYGLIKVCYDFNAQDLFTQVPLTDWIVSTGGDTSFLNAWLAWLFDVKNLYGSSLRGLNPSLFTLLLSSGSSTNWSNEIQLDLAPAPIERQKVNEQGRLFRDSFKLENQTVWAVLIGGEGAGYQYDDRTMVALAQGLLVLAEREGARLLITTSRRTGLGLEKTLKKCFDLNPNVVYSTYFNHHPEKVVARFLGAADVVFCTEDSGSMITEGMAVGKPVYVLAPDKNVQYPFYEVFLSRHVAGKHIRRVLIKEMSLLDVKSSLKTDFCLLRSDPVEELAERIRPWIESKDSSV